MRPLLAALLLIVAACDRRQGTAPPEGGWANAAPTLVERAVDRPGKQLLAVRQGELRTWVEVPDVGAKPGDHVLLGRGTARGDVAIPELGERAAVVVDIAHVRVVDGETARRAVAAAAPRDAVAIGTIYAELESRADRPVVVSGTVVKSTSAVGSVWVHLRDGSGDAAAGTHDLTVKTDQPVTVGQRASFRGTLRKDVDLGFGYHFDALVEDGRLVE